MKKHTTVQLYYKQNKPQPCRVIKTLMEGQNILTLSNKDRKGVI